MSSTILLSPRQQLCNRSCGNQQPQTKIITKKLHFEVRCTRLLQVFVGCFGSLSRSVSEWPALQTTVTAPMMLYFIRARALVGHLRLGGGAKSRMQTHCESLPPGIFLGVIQTLASRRRVMLCMMCVRRSGVGLLDICCKTRAILCGGRKKKSQERKHVM